MSYLHDNPAHPVDVSSDTTPTEGHSWVAARRGGFPKWLGRVPAGRAGPRVWRRRRNTIRNRVWWRGLLRLRRRGKAWSVQGEFCRGAGRTRPACHAHRSHACRRQFVALRLPFRASLIVISRIREHRGRITFRKNSKNIVVWTKALRAGKLARCAVVDRRAGAPRAPRMP